MDIQEFQHLLSVFRQTKVYEEIELETPQIEPYPLQGFTDEEINDDHRLIVEKLGYLVCIATFTRKNKAKKMDILKVASKENEEGKFICMHLDNCDKEKNLLTACFIIQPGDPISKAQLDYSQKGIKQWNNTGQQVEDVMPEK